MEELHDRVIEEFKMLNLEGILKKIADLKMAPGKIYSETLGNGNYIFHVDRIGITVEYSDLHGNRYEISIHEKTK